MQQGLFRTFEKVEGAVAACDTGGHGVSCPLQQLALLLLATAYVGHLVRLERSARR